jgi:hypothetical protein
MTKSEICADRQAAYVGVATRQTRICRLSALMMFISLSATGAHAGPSDPVGLSPDQTTLVKQICSDTMRIRQGYVQYEACVESLSATVANREEVKQLVRAYDACKSAAHKEGTPQYAQCVLNEKGTSVSDQRMGDRTPDRQANIESNRSFTESTSEERRALEERACAKLGLVPGQAAFGNCVSHLDMNLWAAANPS